MPKVFPLVFLRVMVAVARHSDAPIAQVARDFRISEARLQRWLKIDDVEEGRCPGVTQAESAKVRRRRIGFGCWSRRTRFCSGLWCIWDGT